MSSQFKQYTPRTPVQRGSYESDSGVMGKNALRKPLIGRKGLHESTWARAEKTTA